MKKIRIGVVGLGWISRTYVLPVYRAMDEVELAAVCDTDAERLQTLGGEYGVARRYDDYTAMIGDGNLDGVVVAVAPHMTARIAGEFMEAGIHAYIEKPPGISTVETEYLIAAVQRNGVRAMVAFNRRYMPVTDLIKQHVTKLGPVRQASFEFFKAVDTDPSASHTTHDPLVGTAIHGIDLLRYLLGEATGVRGVSRPVGSRVLNSFAAAVDFEDTAAASVNVFWNAGYRKERYTFHGRGYSLVMESPEELCLYRHGKMERMVAPDEDQPGFSRGFPQELHAFVDLAENGRESRSSLADACKTMRLIDMVRDQTL